MPKLQRFSDGSTRGARAAGVFSRLERLPAWLGVLLGLLLGAGFGALFLVELGGLSGSLGYALILSAALWLGFRANWVLDLKLPEPPGSMHEDAATSEDRRPKKKEPKRLLDMVEIPGGRFLMGSARADRLVDESEFPQHEVTLSPFWMSKFPVTIRQYCHVMKETPFGRKDRLFKRRSPANLVTWFDAIRFCNALSEREGLEPCYRFEGRSVEWLRHANGYRLPTEAEWEYAVRAGTQSRYFFGNDEARLGDYAWYAKNGGRKTHSIGKLKRNPFGLSDMLGNVWEWCWDWYGPYPEKPQKDPVGPEDGKYRVLRGGSAWDDPGVLRSAFRLTVNPVNLNESGGSAWSGPGVLRSAGRGRGTPGYRVEDFGFRCVRSLAASH